MPAVQSLNDKLKLMRGNTRLSDSIGIPEDVKRILPPEVQPDQQFNTFRPRVQAPNIPSKVRKTRV